MESVDHRDVSDELNQTNQYPKEHTPFGYFYCHFAHSNIKFNSSEVSMPHHTVLYPIRPHGCGGEKLPADRETRAPEQKEKGVRP